MPRPRVYEPARVLDAVEALAAAAGPAAVTIRAVSAAVGVSNGAVYHTFGSRAGLMARAWLRAGHRFLDGQNELVDHALSAPGGLAGAQAVIAAAEAPAIFAEQYPQSSALLWAVQRDELLESGVSDEIAKELTDLEALLVGLMIRLAVCVWDRKDAAAVDTITMCIVDLPTAILLSRNRLHNTTAREQLCAAVRAVLDIGPPPERKSP
jgi:AcrR family transcriptional regulator